MGHRRVSNPFMISGLDQHDNNHLPVEQPCIPMARSVTMVNGPFAPTDNMLRGGAHPDSRWSSGDRANQYPSSNPSMEVQHYPPPFPGPRVEPYPHSSIPANTSLAPLPPVTHFHSNHYINNNNNIPNTQDVEGGGPFKRKSPGVSESYGAGSSSSSQMLTEKPAFDRHRGVNLSISGEDSMRNVRSRSRLDLEPSVTRTHLSSYSPHFYQSYSAPVHPANLNGDATSREWNSVPHFVGSSHGRVSPPDINGPRQDTSQFHIGGISADSEACHPSVFSRHPVTSSQYHNIPHAQATHSRRSTPSYRNGPGYSYYAHGATSSTNEPQFHSENYSSRYSRHSSGGWRSGYRSGRPRIAVERLQPIVDVMDSHDRLGHEDMMTVDRASFYGGSRNLLDQHRDMRLDIDSMSYEELLALEERIGDVNTGLSEDSMSKCLMEQVYSSLDQNHEEPNCPICLEEYKKGEKVGRMEKCGHGYHVDCIKKWLLMKKVCPICKSEQA